jgi:hypothetical protein
VGAYGCSLSVLHVEGINSKFSTYMMDDWRRFGYRGFDVMKMFVPETKSSIKDGKAAADREADGVELRKGGGMCA